MTRASRLQRPVAILVGLLSLFPFALLGLMSVAGPWPYPDLVPGSLRAHRWADVLGAGRGLLSSLLVSLALSASVALVATAAGYVTGRAVASRRASHHLLFLAYLPYALSPVVLGVCFLYFLIRLGLAGSFAGVALAHLVVAFGWSVVFWSAFWNDEKRALEDLVRTLGGTTGQLFARVLLPLSRGPLVLCFFQAFLISWFQYGLTVLVGSGTVSTLPVKVYDYLGEADLGYAAVASLLLVGPPVVLLLANRRVLRPEG